MLGPVTRGRATFETRWLAVAGARPIRTNGGRGFGITGAHFHKNWGDENFRRLVLNGILWKRVAGGPWWDLPLTVWAVERPTVKLS